MANTIFSPLLVLLLLCIVHKGLAQCSMSAVSVRQAPTGATVEGQAEYEVTVSNDCSCPQSQVTVNCFGLSSVEPVDPTAIKTVDAEKCIVANGRPLVNGRPVKFKYAWKTPQDFPVVSTKINC
ncbi:hypothetical protein Cni_G20207 [Canna indica]|uniref:Uncharacterized protein n=1 Tax=Canna indica TaxID=4628 RepID=A0AAQ3QKJ4_9LILI|nr:hypothetical protein Cni_G20207 [Canna indica]